jgi:hypothetical protein
VINKLKAGIDYQDAIYWLLARKGVAVLPEYDRAHPLMGHKVFQLSHKLLHSDPILRNVLLCTSIAKNTPLIARAIDSQHLYGGGWIDFIDRYNHAIYGSKPPLPEDDGDFVPSWIRAVDIHAMPISKPYQDLFDGLVEHSIDGESCPCSFRSVPIGCDGKLLFTATVIFMLQTPASHGYVFPIGLSNQRILDAKSRKFES